MDTVQVQTQIPMENLLHGVEQLSLPDLENFVSRVMEIQAQRKAPTLSAEESELLLRINQGLSPDTWKQYEELKQKRRAGTLTEMEHQTLIDISNQIEEANARRMESLGQLAILRNVSPEKLMADLQITQQTYE
jgi:hypothetical protein